MKGAIAILVVAVVFHQIQARPPGSVFFYEDTDSSSSYVSDSSFSDDSLESMKQDCINEVKMTNETLRRLDEYPSEELSSEDVSKVDEFNLCFVNKINYLESNETDFDGLETNDFDFPDYFEVVSGEVYSNFTAVVEKCRKQFSKYGRGEKFIRCIRSEMEEEQEQQKEALHDEEDESESLEEIKIECMNEVNLDNETFQRSETHGWEELATEDLVKLDKFLLCYVRKLGYIKSNGEVDFDSIAADYFSNDDSSNNLAVAVASRRCRGSILQETYLYAKIDNFLKCVQDKLK